MHLKLHTEMYDSKNVQALTAIRQEQQNIEQELQEAIEQVGCVPWRVLIPCCHC